MVTKDIVIINPSSNIALCTLWSKKENILKELGEDKKRINIAGTLYTSYGVNYLLQTLGEHGEIDTLVIYGSDRSLSAKTLIEIFSSGKGCLFSKKEISEIIKTVKIVDLRKEYENGNIEKLKDIVKENYSPRAKVRKKVYLKISESVASSFPEPVSGIYVYDTSLFRAWVKIVNSILLYGYEKPSEYKESQLEVTNLLATIGIFGKKYNLEKEFFSWIKKKEFEKHVKDLLSREKPEDVEYTYGTRLFSHAISGDQIQRMIDYLSAKPYSRRCISVVIDPREDFSSKFPPCIGIVQGIISGDYYIHTAYFRSNDMFRGWPVNIYGQIKLAEYIVSKINEKSGTDYKLGYVNTFSFSAHIYRHDWKFAKELVEKYRNKLYEFVQDSKGNFVIYHENDKVAVEHRKNEKLISKISSKNFAFLYKHFKTLSLLPEHALYLGKELFRAFERLRAGRKYMQDEA